jgi:hypothetical protein
LESAVVLDFDSTGFASTDWTGAAVVGAAGGGAVLVKFGGRTPSNDSIANFDAAVPAAKQITAPVIISAALSGPRPPPRAGNGALTREGREIAS